VKIEYTHTDETVSNQSFYNFLYYITHAQFRRINMEMEYGIEKFPHIFIRVSYSANQVDKYNKYKIK